MSDEATFELDAELARLIIRPSDLASLCGVSRITVWKWRCRQLPVPAYALTILRQQQHIKNLAMALTTEMAGA